MKRTILPFGASIVCASLSFALIIWGCNKKGSTNDQQHPHASLEGRVANSEFILSTSNGYAAGTTGGNGGSSITVSDATAFRNAAQSSTTQIITVNGNLNLGSSAVNVKSNKTIVGANSSSGIIGCLSVSNVSNVHIQNLNITNPSAAGSGDGIEVSGSTKVFITKCAFNNCSDGALDIVRASDNVTVSWCRFNYSSQTAHNFVNLIGNGDDVTTDRGKLHVTMHHNWYDAGCKQRMPRVRFGQVHCYNNYYAASASDYCIGVGNESQIKVENCYFLNQSNAWSNSSSSTSAQGKINWNSGNVFSGTSVPSWAPNSSVFSVPYTYSMTTGSGVPSAVTGNAGNK
ncbi:polysaccharide lyase family 1 protein [Niastella sp. OAS944]|uniref:pectate lyase family protein n=1 Tax=Niastella sp. OAS944 TaxID=2664089 RepID=UPI00348D2EF9|nr:pectate lyase [Chitinophagaceae bacterium OAS944]